MKSYIIETERKARTRIVEGTLEELISYFGYTLEVGNSWNKKINREPKTIKALISSLEKSFAEIEGGFDRTSVRLLN